MCTSTFSCFKNEGVTEVTPSEEVSSLDFGLVGCVWSEFLQDVQVTVHAGDLSAVQFPVH